MPTLIIAKSCSRCNGDLCFDSLYREFVCLQCGHTIEIPNKPSTYIDKNFTEQKYETAHRNAALKLLLDEGASYKLLGKEHHIKPASVKTIVGKMN